MFLKQLKAFQELLERSKGFQMIFN